MSQNRQKRQAEHWAHVDLQISLLAEQESTKMLQTMQNICRFLGMEKAGEDPELKQLSEQVPVARLAEEVGKTLLPEEVAVREIAAVLAEEERRGRGENAAERPGAVGVTPGASVGAAFAKPSHAGADSRPRGGV